MVSKYVRMGGVGTWKWGRVSVGHPCWGVISKMGDDPKMWKKCSRVTWLS